MRRRYGSVEPGSTFRAITKSSGTTTRQRASVADRPNRGVRMDASALGTGARRWAVTMEHESATEKQRRVWDRSAAHYDRQIAFLERTWFGGVREWVADRARGRVLEVAIGTGRSLPYYAPDLAVTGIELSPEMLAIARERAAALGHGVDLREGDAADLPFPEASFDTVVCVLALCSIPDPGRAIGEMQRVLVPGGRLLLVDHVGSSWRPLYAVQWLVEQLTRRTAGEYFTRRQRQLVEAAGLQVHEAERLKAGTVERIQAVKAG
jgi:ubiquinone/menaquinone biosynthesis C-methylase UbiE